MSEQQPTPTRHTCNKRRPGHPLPFGRRDPSGNCARCRELAEGATPREAPGWVEAAARRQQVDAARAAEIEDHFRVGGDHDTRCIPAAYPHGVTTCFDY